MFDFNVEENSTNVGILVLALRDLLENIDKVTFFIIKKSFYYCFYKIKILFFSTVRY